MDPNPARRLWMLFEPIHAVVYFSPDAKPTYERAGLKGYWMGYFASRAACLGPASPELVAALFYNFHPDMIRRAIPDAWSFSTPQRVLAARLDVARTALERLLAGVRIPAEAVALMREAAEAGDLAGRPLYAALRAQPWPGGDLLDLWHAATLLREHRGDGHVAALVSAGIDGCEAHVLAAAGGGFPDEQRSYRGWSEEDWSAAGDRLRERGLIDDQGRRTSEGETAHAAVEALTDRLAMGPFAAIGEAAAARLAAHLRPLAGAVVTGDGVPFPNAMGLRRSAEIAEEPEDAPRP